MAEKTASTGPTGPTGSFYGGGSGGDETPRRAAGGGEPRRKPAGLAPQRGRRELKEYPLTDSDIHDLRNIGAGATFCFSVGSLCLGFWSNLYASLAFSDVAKNLLEAGTARQQDALIGAIFFYLVGMILVIMGYTRVADIKAEVDFGEGNQRLHTRLKIIIRGAIFISLLAVSFWLGTKYVSHG
jgi:hypothetical protein